MGIKGDMRQSEFRGKHFIFAEIQNVGFVPETKLILHAKKPDNPKGRVVRMSKKTVQRLRRVNAWKRGFILLQFYGDRPEVFLK